MSTVWFDRKRIAPNVPEDKESVDFMCQQVSQFVDEEVERGISKNRIVLGVYIVWGVYWGCRFENVVIPVTK